MNKNGQTPGQSPYRIRGSETKSEEIVALFDLPDTDTTLNEESDQNPSPDPENLDYGTENNENAKKPNFLQKTAQFVGNLGGNIAKRVSNYTKSAGDRWYNFAYRHGYGVSSGHYGNVSISEAGSFAFFQGYLRVNEYNPYLQGRYGMSVYNRMMREDGQVDGVVDMIKQPILGCEWFVDSDNEEAKAFVEENLGLDPQRKNLNFNKFITESLTFLEFGFCLFEKTFEMRDGRQYLHSLSYRPQPSIEGFKFDDMDGGSDFDAAVQIIKLYPVKETVDIPRMNLVYFGPKVIGQDFWGKSVLRSAYKHWFYKEELYQIDAVAHDRFGVGIPKGRYPEKATKRARDNFNKTLKNLRSHQQSYISMSKGPTEQESFDIEMLKLEASGRLDPMPTIEHHNAEIAKSVLVLFMDLGTSQTGSRATSMTLADVFYHGLIGYVNHMRDVINREVVTPLVEYNFGSDINIKIDYANLQKKSISTLAADLDKLGVRNFVTPDFKLEQFLRRRAELPMKDEDDYIDPRELEMKKPYPGQNDADEEDEVVREDYGEE